MKTYNLLDFGEIDLSGEAKVDDVEVELKGRSVTLDLNFGSCY